MEKISQLLIVTRVTIVICVTFLCVSLKAGQSVRQSKTRALDFWEEKKLLRKKDLLILHKFISLYEENVSQKTNYKNEATTLQNFN
jgi:hypothetical protein